MHKHQQSNQHKHNGNTAELMSVYIKNINVLLEINEILITTFGIFQIGVVHYLLSGYTLTLVRPHVHIHTLTYTHTHTHVHTHYRTQTLRWTHLTYTYTHTRADSHVHVHTRTHTRCSNRVSKYRGVYWTKCNG